MMKVIVIQKIETSEKQTKEVVNNKQDKHKPMLTTLCWHKLEWEVSDRTHINVEDSLMFGHINASRLSVG